MNIILFDTMERKSLFPLTATRAVGELRTGIFTVKERWERLIGAKAFILTEPYLQDLYEHAPAGDYLFIDASIITNPLLTQDILALDKDEAIADKEGLIAGRAVVGSLPGLA